MLVGRSQHVLKVKRVTANALLPRYAYPYDAGLDLFAVEGVTLEPGERSLVRDLEFVSNCRLIPKDRLGHAAGLRLMTASRC